MPYIQNSEAGWRWNKPTSNRQRVRGWCLNHQWSQLLHRAAFSWRHLALATAKPRPQITPLSWQRMSCSSCLKRCIVLSHLASFGPDRRQQKWYFVVFFSRFDLNQFTSRWNELKCSKINQKSENIHIARWTDESRNMSSDQISSRLHTYPQLQVCPRGVAMVAKEQHSASSPECTAQLTTTASRAQNAQFSQQFGSDRSQFTTNKLL